MVATTQGATTKITVNLPWPHKDLSPNARGHWAKKAGATKKARMDAFIAGLDAGLRNVAADAVSITTTFFPPTRARYDDDNLQARCKAYFDGLSDALRIDDRHFSHAPVRRGEVRKNGLVQIEVSA